MARPHRKLGQNSRFPKGTGAWDGGGEDIVTSTITKGIKQFYDSSNGGFQLDGALGALIGFGAAMFITGGGGYGWMGLLAVGLLTIVGANTGNKVGAWLSSGSDKTPKSPSEEKVPAKTLEEPKKATAKEMEEMVEKGPTSSKPDKALTAGDTGILPSPITVTSAEPPSPGQER